MKRLRKAKAAVDKARRGFECAMVVALPIGCRVGWEHGTNWRTGRVLELGLLAQTVKVEAPTGARYWIDVHRIESIVMES